MGRHSRLPRAVFPGRGRCGQLTFFSSFPNSSKLVGTEIIPPNVVRCMVAHSAPAAPPDVRLVVTPSVLQICRSSSQYLHSIFSEQLASRY